MATPVNRRHVYPIEELREAVEQPPPARDWANFASSAIVLDNGASTMRAGWAAENAPRIVSENVVAKYKDRKTNHNMLLAGSEAYADATSRGAVKSPFEGDVLVNFDQMVRPVLLLSPCGRPGALRRLELTLPSRRAGGNARLCLLQAWNTYRNRPTPHRYDRVAL